MPVAVRLRVLPSPLGFFRSPHLNHDMLNELASNKQRWHPTPLGVIACCRSHGLVLGAIHQLEMGVAPDN